MPPPGRLSISVDESASEAGAASNSDGELALGALTSGKAPSTLAIDLAAALEQEAGAPDATPVPNGELALGALSEGFLNFAEADTNRDGVVTREEFVAWHASALGNEPSDADWEPFASADSNRDGKITREEFVVYQKRIAETDFQPAGSSKRQRAD
eukprot:SAG22_NODE_2035_length_3102_cov_3.066933_4_plen_156_part_00